MILDIVLIVLFIGMIIYGYSKGVVGILAKLIAVILSFVLAYLLADNVGEYISKTSFGLKIQTSLTSIVEEKINTASESDIISKIQMMLESLNESEIKVKIVHYMFTGMGFAVVFVISRIVLWFGLKLVESIFELPVLKTFNKLGGIIASTLLFIIELGIILAIIKTVSTLSFMNGIINAINSSAIAKVCYDHNIITNIIITKFIK